MAKVTKVGGRIRWKRGRTKRSVVLGTENLVGAAISEGGGAGEEFVEDSGERIEIGVGIVWLGEKGLGGGIGWSPARKKAAGTRVKASKAKIGELCATIGSNENIRGGQIAV